MYREDIPDGLLDWIARTLQERARPDSLVRRLHKWVRWIMLALTFAGTAGVLALFLSFRWWGEQNPGLAFLLYLPAQLWLLPSLGLAAACLLFYRKLLLWHALVILGVTVGLMGFRSGTGHATGQASLAVVTNNRGQDNGQSLTPFTTAENPDLLILQEDGRADAFARTYPDRFCVSHGEFTLVSKLPILESGFLKEPTWQGAPVAAWFLVDFGSQSLMVYNVHLPTPRHELNKMRGRGLIAAALPLPGSRAKAFRESAREIWLARVALAEALAAAIAKEARPAIVAGDFNMPAAGHVHAIFASALCDAFAECGSGFGFTFPGVTRNPISLFGPWLRLDYAFSNQHLRPVYAHTEPHRHSQHRAVAARFELTPR